MKVKLIRKSMEVHEFDHANKCMKISVSEPRPDRISQLPDDILHRILSFFPQEYVAKTLFLSKRWQNLWTTLPFLCFKFRFDLNKSETNNGIMNFIKKLLSYRDKSTLIEKFCLMSSPMPESYLDRARLNDLIREVVLQHGVLELDLKLELYGVQFCSPFIASSKSLTSLKLWLNFSSREPNFSTYFSFPNLKTMELTYVALGSNFASQLSNNCHKLENLVINKCWFVWVPSIDYSLRKLPNLYRASFSFHLYNKFAIDFLHVISNAEVLSLNIPFLEILLDELEKMDYFSKFHNLKSLEFGTFINYTEKRVNIIERMLQSSPALEFLRIGFIWDCGESEDGSGLIPNCPLSECLKVIKMDGVFPDKPLIKLVKYFLDEAKGLEKVIVCKPPKHLWDEVERGDICQKLQALPNNWALELCQDDACGFFGCH